MLAIKTFNSSKYPPFMKDHITVSPPSTNIDLIPRRLNFLSSFGISTLSVPHFINSILCLSLALVAFPVAIIVLALSSIALAFSGVLNVVSSIILIGFSLILFSESIVREGLSSKIVPIPTRIASHLLLSFCTLSKSLAFDSFNYRRFARAIFPSADAAQLRIMYGLTSFYLQTIKI